MIWCHGACTVCDWRATADQEEFLHIVVASRAHTRITGHQTVVVFDTRGPSDL